MEQNKKPYETIHKEELVRTNEEANQQELTLGIGTKETTSLKPLPVVVLNVEIKEVGSKKAKKLICFCSHNEKKDGISISAVKWENKGKLEVSGLWVNKDDDGMLRKGSALALFLQSNNAHNAEQLVGKTINTVLDEQGYLVFKNY